MGAIERCRTPALGGHLEKCDSCGFERPAYNSCRNRHCPKCQGLNKARWLQARQAEVLPVGYFHAVFTLPHELTGQDFFRGPCCKQGSMRIGAELPKPAFPPFDSCI